MKLLNLKVVHMLQVVHVLFTLYSSLLMWIYICIRSVRDHVTTRLEENVRKYEIFGFRLTAFFQKQVFKNGL